IAVLSNAPTSAANLATVGQRPITSRNVFMTSGHYANCVMHVNAHCVANSHSVGVWRRLLRDSAGPARRPATLVQQTRRAHSAGAPARTLAMRTARAA